MSDYISRDEIFSVWRSMPKPASISSLTDAINRTPAADVEPVRHGRWMHEETEGGFHIWSCSRCGRGMNGNPKGTNLYCYHCGSKMDLEGENGT